MEYLEGTRDGNKACIGNVVMVHRERGKEGRSAGGM